jgi:hypothetical protein
MSGWLYEDKEHDSLCQCDDCDGHRYAEYHRPEDCLFDGDPIIKSKARQGAKQHKVRKDGR